MTCSFQRPDQYPYQVSVYLTSIFIIQDVGKFSRFLTPIPLRRQAVTGLLLATLRYANECLNPGFRSYST
jgi:hypothetical protein